MKFTEMTDHEIYTILSDLQTLVDGQFSNVEEIVAHTGVGTFQAAEILESINLLKSLKLK